MNLTATYQSLQRYVRRPVKNSKDMQKLIYSMLCTETLWPKSGLKSSLEIYNASKFVIGII